MNIKRLLTLLILSVLSYGLNWAKTVVISSPDGKLSVAISNGVTISVSRLDSRVVTVKAAMNGSDGRIVSAHPSRSIL